MAKRSTMLIVIGVAVFVLGAAVVVVSLHAHANGTTKAEVTGDSGLHTAVVVATSSVAAGTSGESLIESKSVALEPVPAREFSADDLTSLASLEQESLLRSLPAGTPVQASDLSADTGPLTPPSGYESIALTLDSGASGLAGYLQPGSDVDVYANVIKASNTVNGSVQLPCVALVAPSVEVLDVSDEVPAYRSDPVVGGRSVPDSITVLVSVSPTLAPSMVYYAENDQLYLVASGQSKVAASNTCSGLVAGGGLVPVS